MKTRETSVKLTYADRMRMEGEQGGQGGAHIVVVPNPWDQRTVGAVVPTSKEQSEAQAAILDFKPFSLFWRDGLRKVSLSGRSFRIFASHTGNALDV